MNAIKTILLTTDFSDTAHAAVPVAQLLARKFDATLVVVHVGDLFVQVHYEPSQSFDLDRLRDEANAQGRRELESFAARHFGDGFHVEVAMPLGVPYVEILKLARERRVDLIVMATHGRGFLSHAVMGSTTERVLRQAPCAVLSVRHGKSDS